MIAWTSSIADCGVSSTATRAPGPSFSLKKSMFTPCGEAVWYVQSYITLTSSRLNHPEGDLPAPVTFALWTRPVHMPGPSYALPDRKVLVEEAVVGREIECSVLGNDDPVASLPGEVIPHAEFYSYEAKYVDENGAALEIPARLEEAERSLIQRLAVKAFKVLCCEGMARVDFFLKANGAALINEINTIPGFTRISM
ncbi:MAG: hypothetical protein JRN23_05650, partial [Nitrososphaerota archaeon]|nr:hypothetical protein [Nitrososphaerota archaeon]